MDSIYVFTCDLNYEQDKEDYESEGDIYPYSDDEQEWFQERIVEQGYPYVFWKEVRSSSYMTFEYNFEIKASPGLSDTMERLQDAAYYETGLDYKALTKLNKFISKCFFEPDEVEKINAFSRKKRTLTVDELLRYIFRL